MTKEKLISYLPRGRQLVYLLISLCVSIAIFSYLLSHVSPAEVLEIIREVDRNSLLIFFILSIFMSLLRTWRYQVLLGISGYSPQPVAMFLVVLVRNFFSDLLPARIGTLVYVYIARTRLGIPWAAAMSSFALAFLFDILALAPLIILAAFFAGGSSLIPAVNLTFGGILLALITIFILFCAPRICSRAAALLAVSSDKTAGKRRSFADFLKTFSSELKKTEESGVYIHVMLLSLLVRIAKYASLYVFLYALLAPRGYQWQDLSPASAFLGICASEFAASLPISGIGGFGVYEGTWAVVFQLLGFPEHLAKLTGISHHLFTQVYGYSLGALALLLLLLPFFGEAKTSFHSKKEPDSLIVFSGKLFGLLGGAALLLFSALHLPLKSSAAKPAAADRASAEELEALAQINKNAGYKILFDSNRSGSFGLYTMNIDGSRITPLFDSSQHEMYPDPSPDGEWIVFARTASLSRRAPAEIWTCDKEGGQLKKLADNGTFPTFSSDGKYIYFERERRKVIRMLFNGSGQSEVFPKGNKSFRRYQIVKPRISADQRFVAFISDRKGTWNSWYASLENLQAWHIGQGCEPAWFSGSSRIAWIKGGDALAGSGIYIFDTEKGSAARLHDAAGPRGHEYFPTVSNNDKLLLFSDCPADQHSHTAANYQIYIKNLPGGEAVRLTFDAFTNRWPKILPTQ